MAKTYYMTRISLLALFLLVGCGQQNQQSYQVAMDYDATGPTGLRVKYAAEGAKLSSSFDAIQNIYIDTMTCTGLQAVGPLVIITSDNLSLNGVASGGQYTIGSGVIKIRLEFSGASYESLQVYRHEFIHYLLDANGSTLASNHQSPFFSTCIYY